MEALRAAVRTARGRIEGPTENVIVMSEMLSRMMPSIVRSLAQGGPGSAEAGERSDAMDLGDDDAK